MPFSRTGRREHLRIQIQNDAVTSGSADPKCVADKAVGFVRRDTQLWKLAERGLSVFQIFIAPSLAERNIHLCPTPVNILWSSFFPMQ
jgi:hypothetical protein